MHCVVTFLLRAAAHSPILLATSLLALPPTMTTAAAAPAVAREYRIALDHALIVGNRTALKQRVLDALEAGHRDVVLDASTCGYIDGSGLGVLVSCSRHCRDVGGSLTLEGVTGDTRTLLEITHLDTVLTVREKAS